MKKFMTVLLVIAVMFTFSFSTAFAAEKTYSAAEVEAELDLTISTFITVAEAQKTNVFAQYAFDTDGYATVDGVKVTKEAIEVGFEDVVDQLADIMEAEKETIVDGLDATATYTKSTLDGYKATVTAGLTYEATGISSYLNGQPALFAAQAPLTKDATVAKMEKNYAEADYPAKGEFVDGTAVVTGKLTAQQVISQVKAEAVKAIAEADKTLAAELKTAGTNKSAQKAAYKKVIAAYGTAYTAIASRIANFTDDGEGVKTNEGIAADEKQDALAAATNVAAMKQYVYGTYYNAAMAWAPTAWVGNDAIYKEDTTGTGVTVFGVHIAKKAAPTTTELAAYKAALADAIEVAVKAAEVYYEAGNTAAVYGAGWKFSDTVNNAAALADKYQDVVDYGNKLKAHYVNGVKTYDDAKVEAVLAAAEAIVYADLDETAASFKAKTAETYIELAAEKVHEKAYAGINEALDALENTSASLLAKFEKAQADAVKKFYSAGTTPQIKVLYGTNKTAEEDLVYLQAGYAVASDWTKVADKAVAAINAAESYADIEAALATAKAELAKITPADDALKLANLKTGYKSAIEGYAAQKAALADAKVYTVSDYTVDAVAAAKAEIDKAKTLAEADAKYAEAQAIVDSVVPTADREAAEAAVKAAIKALPAASKVTLADAAAIDAVRAQYDAYAEIPGADVVYATRLEAAEAKVFELEAKALGEELKAMAKKVKAIGTGVDDATIAAALAAKAEVAALNDKVEAYNDEVDAYNLAYTKAIAKIASADATAVANFEGTIYDDEMVAARYAIAAIGADLENADAAKVVAAREAFDKLTEKQQFALEYWGERLATAEKNVAGVEEAAKIAAIEGIKIKANSSAKKGSITVKWTVDEEVEGVKYQVYKSTKAQKGYKKAITTSKTSFKNTKNLEKGTRYFYKVRAIAEVDGVTYYSDWSNKANRIAK